MQPDLQRGLHTSLDLLLQELFLDLVVQIIYQNLELVAWEFTHLNYLIMVLMWVLELQLQQLNLLLIVELIMFLDYGLIVYHRHQLHILGQLYDSVSMDQVT